MNCGAFVVLMGDAAPWAGRAQPAPAKAWGGEQQACTEACAVMGVYWPQLAARGWRIVPAILEIEA